MLLLVTRKKNGCQVLREGFCFFFPGSRGMEMQTYTIGYGKFRVQEWLLKAKISTSAKMTYTVLATCSGGKDHTWPSQKYLADQLMVSVRSIQRYLQELVRAGLITICWERIKGCSRRVYWFLQNKITGPDSPNPVVQNRNSGTTKMVDQHDNLSPHLDNKEKVIEIPPFPPSVESNLITFPAACGAGGNFENRNFGEFVDNQQWQEAKEKLHQEYPEISPLLNLLTSRMTDSGFILEGPNHIFMAMIEKNHGKKIEIALKQAGVLFFSYGIQPAETMKKIEENFQAVEALRAEANRKAQAATILAARVAEDELSKLPLKKQFELLANEYPLKKSQWIAWEIFSRMSMHKELPNISILLKSICNHKSTDTSWNKDGGRWIPALSKWLKERRWMDKPYG